jgi:SEC-C motif-containing protein
MECPCRLREAEKLEYSQCCGLIIDGQAKSYSATALMRSRYTAYVLGKIEHIAATQTNNDDFDAEEAKMWAAGSEWLGLDVVQSKKEGPNTEIVEFKAYYLDKSNEKTHVHHEIAEFKSAAEKWLYDKGSIMGAAPYVRSTPKPGRNDPCLCGSGKKYKKCCG